MPVDTAFTDILGDYASKQILNANFTAAASAFEDCVNIAGDTLTGPLDMNSNQILNLPAPIHPTDPIRLEDLNGLIAAYLAAH